MKGGVFRGVFGIKNIGKQTRRNLSCRVPQSLFVSRHRKKQRIVSLWIYHNFSLK